jgi:1-acyl-sn-glycerol-3-phosphate acyltransferase
MSDTTSTSCPVSDLAAGTVARSVNIIAAANTPLATKLTNALERQQPDWTWRLLDSAQFNRFAFPSTTSVILIPPVLASDGMTPHLPQAQPLLEQAASHFSGPLVLISSALVYGTGPNRQALVHEDYPPLRNENRVCEAWVSLEALAARYVDGKRLTILRPAITWGWPALFTRRLSHRFVASLPGHDPSLQFLSLSDLAAAVICALKAEKPGTYNVSPDSAVPLHAAIRISGGARTPIPRTLQRIVRKAAALEFLRHPWTVSNQRIKDELGYVPRASNVAALEELTGRVRRPATEEPNFDVFGMDKGYINFYGKSFFKFFSDCYWRIEDKGLEHIPKEGTAVLVGMHRGFMPWDGVMALHTVVRKTGRYPRFLTHPGLLKFPYLANFMTKLGGVIACQESADHVLKGGELLGIFPEGIHGAFTPYRQAYKLQAFGRDAFVKVALRHRAPIIPFVTVGSAEIYPIFAKIKSRRWTRYTDWPCIPITATFPFLPFPLPSKWHTEFLPPVSVDQYPPEAAENRVVVKAISLEVRTRMQHAVDQMLSRRRSIFFGSIFERSTDEGQSKQVAI